MGSTLASVGSESVYINDDVPHCHILTAAISTTLFNDIIKWPIVQPQGHIPLRYDTLTYSALTSGELLHTGTI